MKKLFKAFAMALSLGVIYSAVHMYFYESEKVAAINDHASFLANKEEINYVSLEEEKKAKAEAKKQAEEEEKARLAEEKRKQEEEKKRQEELKQQELEKAKIEEENKKNSTRLEVSLINQLPEYRNGCEATSLTMLLNYAGVSVDKNTVVSKMKKDATEIKYDEKGNIIQWGNPQVGFVGDVTGKAPGYSIDPVALASVINEFLPGKALDLTGCEFYKLEEILHSGRPIVVWVNTTFEKPSISYNWTSNGTKVTGYKNQHAVLLTGYDKEYFYYNDPLGEKKDGAILKDTFKTVWTGMGNKALTYYK